MGLLIIHQIIAIKQDFWDKNFVFYIIGNEIIYRFEL